MKVLSVRRGFASDHSSTSYEFLAVDKPLGKEARSAISQLSRRVRPTRRRAHFVYHVGGYDIPGGWENLMTQYYDVMYCENYDWWTLAMAYNAAPGHYESLVPFEFSGTDDLGVRISKKGSRLIIAIHCTTEAGFLGLDYDAYDDEDDEEDESDALATDDELLNMLVMIRRQIIDGDYRTLYAVWVKYGDGENPPPKPENRNAGREIIDGFKNMLSRMD